MGRDDKDDPGNAARLCRAHQGTVGTVNVYTVVLPSAVDLDLELFSQVGSVSGIILPVPTYFIRITVYLIFENFSSKLSNLSLIT
jgi:hypothetical protein